MSAPFLPNNSLESSKTTESTSLVKKLLVTWFCGLLFGWAVFLTIYFLAGFVGAAAASFGSFNASGWIWLTLCLGLLAMLLGPILLGVFMLHDWRKGAKSAFLGLVMGAIGLFIFWEASSFLEELFSSNLELFYSLLVAVPSVIIVITIVLRNEGIKHPRLLGLVSGVIIGIGLSIACGLLYRYILLAGNNVFHLLWLTPPLVWVSAIYFPVLFANGTRWRGLISWALLILITFGLPFVIVPLFRLG